jgi:chaperonin GroEL
MSDGIVKNLSFGKEASDKVFAGIEKLAKAVGSTLGAGGKCVLLEDSSGNPVITKDGVSVADFIILLDPVENMGATLLKEAARKTVREAGDGTTTATVLAHSILKEAYKYPDSNARKIKDGIESMSDKVIKYIEKNKIAVTGAMIDQVATISTNNDKELGKLVGDAFRSVGETGIVMMETSVDPECSLQIVEGVQYNKGLTNTHFITNIKNKTAELENALVLLIESPVDSIRQIQHALEHVIKNNRQLLIIADLEPSVISALAMNKMKGNIKVNVINAPTYGISKKEILDDLALLTGATIINEDLGDDMDMFSAEVFGTCIKSVTSHEETVLHVDAPSEEILSIIEDIKAKLLENNSTGEVIKLERRLARLSAKIAIVKVGANSSIELKEKADRIEDAICATKAAIKEGIVSGGGIALLNASHNIDSFSLGEEILLDAIRAPFSTILDNAGIEEVPLNVISKVGYGLNVITGETVNMIEAGIIDPVLVTKSALRNAVSVATTILSTNCVINNLRLDGSNR